MGRRIPGAFLLIGFRIRGPFRFLDPSMKDELLKLLNINVSVIFQLRCTGLGEVNSVSSREVHHLSYHALASH